MSTGWPQTVPRTSLTDATPASVTDGRTNTEMNCVNGPTKLGRKPMMLANGSKKVVQRAAEQFLTWHISAGHSTLWDWPHCIRANLYRTHFPARYRGFQFHDTHAIGAAPMARYTRTPKNSPVASEEVA